MAEGEAPKTENLVYTKNGGKPWKATVFDLSPFLVDMILGGTSIKLPSSQSNLTWQLERYGIHHFGFEKKER